jgi:hypothetical protein
MDIPTSHSSQDDLAPPCPCSPHLNSGDLREEGNKLPSEMVWIPRSLGSLALYGNTNKLQLPFKSLEEEFKVTRAREVVQDRDSCDPKVAKLGSK